MSEHRISFNRPAIVGRELEQIRAALEAGQISGDGEFTRRVSDLLVAELGCEAVVLTTSCTDALEMAALLLELGPGDEVIVPAFAFVSCVNPFVLRGARPVFCDVRADTLNLDEARLEALVGPATRAILPVHYAGVGCEMDAILEIAERRGVAVVEDNAHGLFGKYRGRWLGSFGALATQSFHETKNFSCGEGGALLINDPRHAARAEILRDKGTNRQALFRGEVDRYTWVDVGSSFALSDLLAAFLYAQLQQRDTILRRRAELWQRYDAALRGWIEEHGVALPTLPAHCEHAYHLYHLVLPTPEMREGLTRHLAARGIQVVTHYTPLHRSRMGRRLGGEAADCPVTDHVTERLLRLPFYHELTAEDQGRVVEAIRSFCEQPDE